MAYQWLINGLSMAYQWLINGYLKNVAFQRIIKIFTIKI